MSKAYYSRVLSALAVVYYFSLFSGPQKILAQREPEKSVSFIDDVAPILKEHCFTCHNAKKTLGKYNMTTFEKLMAGGVSGDPIVAGKPETSELYKLIVTADERRMPPKGQREAVSKDKAAIIARWIKEGAKLDTGLDSNADLAKELRARWKPPVPSKLSPSPVNVNALAVTPNGKELIVGGHHELIVWAINTGKPAKRIYTRTERSYALAFLPDGKLAVAGGRPGQEGDVRIYNIAAKGKMEGDVEVLDGVNDRTVLVKHLFDIEDSVLCLAITPDGKTLAAGGFDRSVRVFDLSAGLDKAKLEQTVEVHTDCLTGCALTADGKYLVTAGRDKNTMVWDLKAKEPVVTFSSEKIAPEASDPTQPKHIEPSQAKPAAETPIKTNRDRSTTPGSKAALVLYRQYCSMCHGDDGRGKELRSSMPPLPDFASTGWQEKNSTTQISVSILDGKGKLMPAFRGRITEEQTRDLATLIKAFGPGTTANANAAGDDFEKQFRALEDELKTLQKQYLEIEKNTAKPR